MVCTGPSVNVTAGVLQAAEAVAIPKAAVIADEEGLQPRFGVAPVIIIVGGLGAINHLTVLVTVAELPQASTAVNVLVCDALQLVVDILPSEEVIVMAPQPSVAVAEPSEASTLDGLQPSITSV